MGKVNVIVKDKLILELLQDAYKGDLIYLNELVTVDTTYINRIIEQEKDTKYQAIIKQELDKNDLQHEITLKDLKNQIATLIEANKQALLLQEQQIKATYDEKINGLNNEVTKLQETKEFEITAIKDQYEKAKLEQEKVATEKYQKVSEELNLLKTQYDLEIKNKETEINNKYQAEILNLKNDLENVRKQQELLLKQQELELAQKHQNDINKLINDNKEAEIKHQLILTKLQAELEQQKNEELNNQKDRYLEELAKKEEMILNLQRQKASLNIKQTGEDLEAWCNNEVLSYMQNGFTNCTWEKDNKLASSEGETKKTKADFIFKVYTTNNHLDDELLTSVCLDMKDENPDSTNKKSNKDYYNDLHKNRIKKACKYAVLVSNLEMDKPNLLPIFKVNEYADMYVVRPAYLMTFLNLITSLTVRFQDLILSKEQEELKLKDKLKLLEDFEAIKLTYLDKPLEQLEKNINGILKSSEDIKKAADNIETLCLKINTSYIYQIQEKINKFELKVNKYNISI